MAKKQIESGIEEEIIKDKLTARSELFLQYYVKNDELFGNATLAYAEAYNYKLDTRSHEVKKGEKRSEYDKWYYKAAACASKLLKVAKVNERKVELLNEWLSDKNVDAELAKIIRKGDVTAIREYNRLKKRVSDSPNNNINLGFFQEQQNKYQ